MSDHWSDRYAGFSPEDERRELEREEAEEEELSERASRLLGSAADGSPLGDLRAALNEIERLRAIEKPTGGSVDYFHETTSGPPCGPPVVRHLDGVVHHLDYLVHHVDYLHGVENRPSPTSMGVRYTSLLASRPPRKVCGAAPALSDFGAGALFHGSTVHLTMRGETA